MLEIEEQKVHLFPSNVGQSCLPGSDEFIATWTLPDPHGSKSASFREVVIPERVSVSQLALMLGQKPFQIIADLMELGVFGSVNQELAFDVASKILSKYGLLAKKSA